MPLINRNLLQTQRFKRLKLDADNKALLTCNLCLFSRPIDGVTVKCNQIVLEATTKYCKPRLQILHKDVFDLKLPIILPLSVF